ncbi:MAG: AmmeMemoRadiSam system protein B [Lentisphaerae bacterium GWF2_52_8]|nr:MAG: AmmeMemoRadiSam system protein B [Lentisphaerae bacterium GWF2_52_8]
MNTALGIRKACVAGQFYEANPKLLRDEIRKLAAEAKIAHAPNAAPLRAAILPHAGYIFSAASAIKTLLSAPIPEYSRALVIAPSHRVPFRGLALCSQGAYETPLGQIALDTEGARQILNAKSPFAQFLDLAHENEHALEVELPLLQELCPPKILLPLICGHLDVSSAHAVAELLLPFWEPQTLWIISSDFTHFGNSFGYLPFQSDIRENLNRLDLGAAELIANIKLEDFDAYLERTGATICGANPIMILLAVLENVRKTGEKIKGKVAAYSNSGELNGEWSHCVSYAGIAFSSE